MKLKCNTQSRELNMLNYIEGVGLVYDVGPRSQKKVLRRSSSPQVLIIGPTSQVLKRSYGGAILVLQFATPVTERLVEHFLQHQKVLKSSSQVIGPRYSKGPNFRPQVLDPTKRESSKRSSHLKILKVGGTILVLHFATPVTERLVEHFLQHQKILKSSDLQAFRKLDTKSIYPTDTFDPQNFCSTKTLLPLSTSYIPPDNPKYLYYLFAAI